MLPEALFMVMLYHFLDLLPFPEAFGRFGRRSVAPLGGRALTGVPECFSALYTSRLQVRMRNQRLRCFSPEHSSMTSITI